MSKQSDALREYFEKKGIMQKDVCAATGMGVGTLSNILSGRFQISKNAARKLAEAYGFSIPFLITGEGQLLTGSPLQIQNVDRSPHATISQVSRDAEVAQLREQLAQANAEKDRLLGIIEGLTKK